MGYSEQERSQMREWDKDEEFGGLSALYNNGDLQPSGSTDPNAAAPATGTKTGDPNHPSGTQSSSGSKPGFA
jgi:hypothetical protein